MQEPVRRRRTFRFRSIFSRLLATYLVIVILTTVLLAVLVPINLRKNAINDSIASLTSSAETVRELFNANQQSGGTGTQLETELSRLGTYGGMNIWIADSFDVIYYNISGNSALTAHEQLLLSHKEQMLSLSLDGESCVMMSENPNLYNTPIISVSLPIYSGEKVVGVIFVHTILTSLENTLQLFFTQLAISIGLSLALALILIYMTSRQIGNSLNKINLAARELAGGHFDKRIENIHDANEVGQLADTFNMMADELEKYENTRTSFVANVSHELRSPLTSIQGFVQGMLDDTIEEADKKQYLEIVLAESKRLSSLIGELLDLAKIESGQFPLNITAWDINELIRRCLINFLTKIEDKNIEMVINLPDEQTMVLADQQRLAQVLTNLIDNAVKFTEPGGTLKVWTYYAQGKTHVNIANTGNVIPEEDLPFVFDRFFKVDKSHNRRAPGTGIGLSIVKNIIIQHEEKIWVSSKPGTGTVFTFTLKNAPKKAPNNTRR